MTVKHLVLAPLLLLTACTGGGGGGTEVGTADVVLTTTASPAIFALEAELASLELVRADGGSTGNLLDDGVATELEALEQSALWLSGDQVKAGTYTSARVAFAPGSFAAKGAGGGALTVAPEGLVLEAPLLAPLAIGAGSYSRVEVYLDLVASLTASTADPAVLAFDPDGAFRELGLGEAPALAPFFGIVTGASLGAKTLAVEVYRDAELLHPLRTVDVTLADDALLVDINDVVFPGVADFYAALMLGKTVVEVSGELAGAGSVLASKVEILSHTGKTEPKVVITGKVLHVDDPAQQLVLLIQHVDQGAELAGPVLESIGDPSAIDVSWDEHTAFFDHHGELSGGADISEGQMVQVEFADFSWPPFPAAKIVLLGVGLTGTIDDVAGLPDSFVLRLGGGALVTIYLSETTELRLDTQFKPEIETAELVVGMKATVKGDPHTDPPVEGDGDPATDGVDAQAVKVHHGYLLQADVAAADELLSTLWTSTGHIAQTFGVLAPEGPLRIVIAPGCLFGQDAANEAELFDLIASGAAVELKVKGVGADMPGEIHAYDLKAKAKKKP